MPPLEVPRGPEPFSGWWLAGGICLATLAALLMALPPAWRYLKRKRAERAAARQQRGPTRRETWSILREISRIEREWKAGKLTDRTAAQELSAALRSFVAPQAETMTLMDLENHDELRDVAEWVAQAYPVEFGVVGEGDISAMVETIRVVVRQ